MEEETHAAAPDVLSTHIEDGIAVVTLGSPQRILFDREMSDAPLGAMLSGDDTVRAGRQLTDPAGTLRP